MLSRSGGEGYSPLEMFFETPVIDHADTLLHLAWSTLPATSEEKIGIEWQHDLPLLFRILRAWWNSPRRERLSFYFFLVGRRGLRTVRSRPAE